MSEAKTAAKSAPKKAAAKKLADSRVAKIRALKTPVKVPGGTLAKGGMAEGVPLKHAEYLRDKGEAEILQVS